MRHLRLFFLLVSLFHLAGCRLFNTPESADDLLTAGWAGPTPHPSEATSQPIYCYQTLGHRDCYRHQQQGWESRLTGAYEPHKVFFPIISAEFPLERSIKHPKRHHTPIKKGCPRPLNIKPKRSQCSSGCF